MPIPIIDVIFRRLETSKKGHLATVTVSLRVLRDKAIVLVANVMILSFSGLVKDNITSKRAQVWFGKRINNKDTCISMCGNIIHLKIVGGDWGFYFL